jgi:hypothetical protein
VRRVDQDELGTWAKGPLECFVGNAPVLQIELHRNDNPSRPGSHGGVRIVHGVKNYHLHGELHRHVTHVVNMVMREEESSTELVYPKERTEAPGKPPATNRMFLTGFVSF